MRRILSVIVSITMAAAMLVGCGGDNSALSSSTSEESSSVEETEQEAEQETEQEETETESGDATKVTALFFSLEGEYFTMFDELFKEGFAEIGYEYESHSSNMDSVTMIEQIENAVAKDTDILWLWAVEGKSVADALQRAKDKDVIVYSFVQDPGNGAADIVRGIDQEEAGRMIADLAIQWADDTYGTDAEAGSINTIIFHNEDSEVDKLKSDAMSAEIKTDPRFNVLEDVVCESSTVATQSSTENMFVKYSDIDCVITPVGSMSLGVCAYLTSESCTVENPADIGVIGSEIDSELANYIRNDIYDATVVTGGNLADNIATMISEMQGLVDGTQEGGFSSVDVDVCTKENVDQFGY